MSRSRSRTGPSRGMPPAKAAVDPSVRKLFSASGRATLGLLLTPLLLGGCFFKTTFSDMSARIDALDIPERYERVGERRSGTKPAFFGHDPSVTRRYRSPDDFETTCAELEEHFAARSPHIVRLERKCSLGFKIRSGASAMALANFRYSVSVAALEREDESGTVVRVVVVDRAP